MAVRLEVTLDDKGSVGIKKLGGNVKKLGQTVETQSQKIRNSWGRMEAGFGRAAGKIKRAARIVAIALIGLGTAAVKMAADFDKGVAEIATLMQNVTEQSIVNMKNELRALAIQSGQSLKVLTKARYDIVSAGFASAATSAQVLNTSVKAAVGGVSTAAAAADILTSALNSYQLTANSATKVSDILFTTVRLGKTTLDQLSQGLGNVLPIANAAGLTLKGVGAAIATLTASGLKTERAVTALRGALVAFSSPTDQARDAMRKLEVSLIKTEDGSLNLLKTIEQFKDFDARTIGRIIPDVRASLAIVSLANNIEKLRSNTEEFNDVSGATQRAFDIMADRAGFKLAQAIAKIKDLFIDLGDRILPIVAEAADKIRGSMDQLQPKIETFARAITNFINFVIQHADIIGKLFVVATITLVAGKLISIAASIFTVIKAVAAFTVVIAGIVSWPVLIGVALAGVVTAFILMSKQSGAALEALGLAGKALFATLRDVKDNIVPLMDNFKVVLTAPFVFTIGIIKRFVENFQRIFANLSTGIQSIIDGFFKLMTGDFDAGFESLKTAVADFGTDVFAEMKDLFGGAGADAGKFFNDNIQETDFTRSEELWKQAGAKFGEVFKAAFQGAIKPDTGLPEIVTPDVAGISDEVTFGENMRSGIVDAEEAFQNLSAIGQTTASGIANAFGSAFSAIGSEVNILFDRWFGKAKSTFQKIARSFVVSMISAFAQIAAQAAASAFISLLFPSLGGFKSIFGLLFGSSGSSGGDQSTPRGPTTAGALTAGTSSVSSQTFPSFNNVSQSMSSAVQIGRANINVGGIIDTKTLDDIKNMVSEDDSRLAERIQNLVVDRKLKGLSFA